MTRVVIDTGVIVSALLQRDGTSRKALTLALNHCQLMASVATVTELKDVLGRPKFRKAFTQTEANELISLVTKRSDLIDVHSTLAICRDSTDNMFLNLAIDGKANIMLSRDLDLLTLHPFRGIPVLNPADFLNWMASKQA